MTLRVSKNDLRLRIRDNGVGFVPSSVRGRGGLGLVGMEERVRLLNGRLRLIRRPQRGVTIEMAIPLPGGEKWTMKRFRVLLADDHTLLLDGIRLMIEPEFELVGSVEDGNALVHAAKRLKPDLVLLDIAMPVLNGIDAAYELHKSLPSAKLIMVTMHRSGSASQDQR